MLDCCITLHWIELSGPNGLQADCSLQNTMNTDKSHSQKSRQPELNVNGNTLFHYYTITSLERKITKKRNGTKCYKAPHNIDDS